MNPDEKPFLPEATALRQGAEARVPEEEAARADERSSRKMMDAPRDEQDRCAQLAAAVPGGLFSFRLRPDGSSCCPYANPAFLELFGLPAEDLAESAAALWATLHPDDLDRVRASVAASARTLTPWRDEFRWRRPNGEAVWVEGHAMPVREPDGSILWHGFVQDVTARKETERRLFATHERLQALLQALPVGVSFSEDATCQHITGNPMLRAQFEMTPQDNISASAPEATALGRRVRYFFDGQELREVELPLQRAVAENRVIPPLELAVQLPSGRRWIAEIRAAPLRDAQDRIIGGLAVILDITERKQAEERYQTLFEHMLDGFALHEILCDARGQPVDYRFLAVNPAFERLTGLKANAIVGKTVREVLPSTEPHWIETYGRVALTGEPASFENYARDLDQYFQVTAFRPAPRQFACLFVDITARKRAEDVLWKTQNRLAEAQKIAHLGSFEYDVATQQTVWSDEEYRIYGLEPAQPSPAYDRLLAQCIHPDDVALLHQTFTTALQRGSVYELEHRIVRPDGRVRWVYDLAHPHFDANGQLVRYIGTTLDITERQHAAEALRLGEERLRLALEGARMGTFHWTVATGDLIWSGTYRQLHGLPPGTQGSYERWLAALHPEDREPADRQIRQAMENHTDFDTEYRIPWPDGTQRWLAAKGRFFDGADGAPQRMEGVVTDITERKSDEERLRRSEERLRLATDGAELGIWYWEMSTGALEWSDRCKRHLGLPPGQEPSFEHFYAVMHPDDRDRIARLLEQARANRSDYRADYRVTWPDGSLHWISAPGRVYGAANGDLIGMGGVTIDITARQRAEEERENAAGAVGPGPEDGIDRTAGGRGGPRFQQPARRDPRPYRAGAGEREPGATAVCGPAGKSRRPPSVPPI